MSAVQNPALALGYAEDPSLHTNHNDYSMLNAGSADIAKWDVVTLFATITASQGFAIKQSDASADDDGVVIGVAQEAIPAGKTGIVRTHGYTWVNVDDASSIVLGDFLWLHASADGAADELGQTTVGEAFAVALGAEDLVGTNLVPCWIDKTRLGTAA